MSDSTGISGQAIQRNALKMTPPKYVSGERDFVTVSRSVRGKSQGRNEPCACGSGLKYKQCHGKVVVPGLVKSARRVLGAGVKP